jgi:hypothetical protein
MLTKPSFDALSTAFTTAKSSNVIGFNRVIQLGHFQPGRFQFGLFHCLFYSFSIRYLFDM